jgi:predicted nuclease with RNAse H fold
MVSSIIMEKDLINFYIGIDVQIKRGCAYYIINKDLEYVQSGWFTGSTHDDVCRQLGDLISQLLTQPNLKIAVGIDAPRMGLLKPRTFYWRGGKWHSKTSVEKGFGRHCEIVIKALGIANPQWTRLRDASPPWMELGYKLFKTLREIDHLYEVFPSASYAMLKGKQHPLLDLSFSSFAHGPKDMLDACMSAYTVHAFLHGRGFEVGGGDGLGTIILPGALPVSGSHPVLHWPEL